MGDLSSDFNIGFRTESCIEELKKYQKGENVNNFLIDDILDPFEKIHSIFSKKGSFVLYADKYENLTSDYIVFLFGKYSDYMSKKDMEMLHNNVVGLERTVNVLSKISKNKPADKESVQYAIDFLSDASKKALCRSVPVF
jgi:hypothetical protein